MCSVLFSILFSQRIVIKAEKQQIAIVCFVHLCMFVMLQFYSYINISFWLTCERNYYLCIKLRHKADKMNRIAKKMQVFALTKKWKHDWPYVCFIYFSIINTVLIFVMWSCSFVHGLVLYFHFVLFSVAGDRSLLQMLLKRRLGTTFNQLSWKLGSRAMSG